MVDKRPAVSTHPAPTDGRVTSHQLRARLGSAGVGFQFRTIALKARELFGVGVDTNNVKFDYRGTHAYAPQEAEVLYRMGVVRWYGDISWAEAAAAAVDPSVLTPDVAQRIHDGIVAATQQLESERDRLMAIGEQFTVAA